MDALEAIFTRKSTRKFLDKPVEDEKIQTILRAGMSGPSCVNARDWEFLVVKDKGNLTAMAGANGRPADPLKGAAFGVMILGDLKKAFPPAKEYWVIDGAIAAQNMILAAQDFGIGSVWLGTWPQMDRVNRQKELFDIPDRYIPHSVIAFGYPAESTFEKRDQMEPDKVHYEKW